MRALPSQVVRRLLTFAALLLLFVAGANSVVAQTDVIRGKVTSSDGLPLANVRVTATSIPGNITRSAQTNAQGNFQLPFPNGTGDYIMGYAIFGYAFRQFQVKRLVDEEVLIADTRLAPMQLDTLVVTAQQQQRVNRNAGTPDVSGTEQVIMNTNVALELMGDLAAMAALLPGVLLLPGLDGAPDAFSVLGLDGDQNSTTLNGMQMGANGLPRDAGISTSLTTSSYDVSRGGFSGGNFNVRSRPGSNFRMRGASLQMTTPQVQWADRAAQAAGNDYTNFSLSGVASGPLKPNKAFYNISAQFDRNARDNLSLLSVSELGLQTAGVAMDSVSRFLGLLNGYGIPGFVGRSRPSRYNDSGRLFGSIDFSPPGSTSGQSIGITFNGNWSREVPTAGGLLALESAGGNRTRWSGGLQARHSGYLGLILSESSAGINVSHNSGDAFLDLPAGRVRVVSGNGVQSLTFGGNQGLSNSSSSTNVTFQNNLSWFDNANKHRLKFTTEVQYSGSRQDQSSNLLGSFSYNSLEDFAAGRPASFSRTLNALERSGGQWNGSLSLGDSYRHSPNLQFQFGLRLDGSRPTETPAYNSLVESTFGLRNDRVPTPIVFSPRIGFSWTLGTAPEIAAFSGAVRGPRAVVRGGIGVFSNASSAGQLNAALVNTGLPNGVQQIVCVGSAVPIPDWDTYANNRDMIPDRCADGSAGSVFSNGAPNVTVFARDYAPQKSVRSNLGWSGSVLDARFSLNLNATYSLNLNQQRFVDLNFDPRVRFSLADGRPVFVEPASIVESTGAIASRDARVSPSFARVSETRSDLESRTAQLQVGLAPIQRTPTNLGWSLNYTYSHIREQVSGFNSTAGDPLLVEWARSGQGPHQVNYNLRYRFFNAVNVAWNGSFRSGSAFTPTMGSDINGDGYFNDRAYVFAPGSNDALALGMRELLANTSGASRRCLEKQLNQIAARNSCRGPWSSSASLSISLDRAKFRMPQRGEVTFSLTNPLGAADLLVNGSDNLKGWGQNSSADPSLLYVRGFDPITRQYRYEVNQRFGATRPQFQTFRQPVVLTAQVKLDLGPTRERQSLSQQLSFGRTQPGSKYPEQLYRSSGSNSVSNPMSTILRQQDSLRLTAFQADSIASMNRRYTYRADSLWAPVAKHFAALPNNYDNDAAYDRYIAARRAQIDMLADVVAAVRDLLTPEQRRKLPAFITNFLDPRYLALIRSGNSMYIGSGVGGPMFFGGDVPMLMAEAGMRVMEIAR